MAQIPVRVLHQATARVLARVKAGEAITLTERGAVIAHIVPAVAGPLDDLITAGRVHPAVVRGPAPRPASWVALDSPEAGELLSAMRAEERH